MAKNVRERLGEVENAERPITRALDGVLFFAGLRVFVNEVLPVNVGAGVEQGLVADLDLVADALERAFVLGVREALHDVVVTERLFEVGGVHFGMVPGEVAPVGRAELEGWPRSGPGDDG